jgi:hypothetical protein
VVRGAALSWIILHTSSHTHTRIPNMHSQVFIIICYVMFGFIVVRVTMYVCYVRNLRWPITRLTGAS